MTKYLVTYYGPGMPSDPAEMEQAMQAFGMWLQNAGSAVVDPGSPLKFGAQVSNSDSTSKTEIGGYSIIQADSLEAAKDVLKSHPFVARGGTLQLDEVMAIH